MFKNVDKELVTKGELLFIKENNTCTLTLTDDGVVEYYKDNKLIESKPFSKLTINRLCTQLLQEGYTLTEDNEGEYNVYLLVGGDGVYNSELVCTVTSKEQAEDKVLELQSETGCNAYYEKVLSENKKLNEADNSERQQDLEQTEQELKDQIEKVDELQNLKNELEDKVDKLVNESKEEIMSDLNIEPGSDEEEQLDNILETDYDLLWDSLDEDEQKLYTDVASSIRDLEPEEALIDIESDLINKAQENHLQKDILTYAYLNKHKDVKNESFLTPIPDELKQKSYLKPWTEEMWQDYYLRMNMAVRAAYKNDGDTSDYIKQAMKRFNIDIELNKQNLKKIADKVAEAYANGIKEKYEKVYNDDLKEESLSIDNEDFDKYVIVEYNNNKPIQVISFTEDNKPYFTDIYSLYLVDTFNTQEEAQPVLDSLIDKVKEQGNDLKIVKYDDIAKELEEMELTNFPSTEVTKEILTPNAIIEIKPEDINLSEKQLKYLQQEDLTIQDILNGLKSLVSELKYISMDEPFISLDDYINEITKNF